MFGSLVAVAACGSGGGGEDPGGNGGSAATGAVGGGGSGQADASLDGSAGFGGGDAGVADAGRDVVVLDGGEPCSEEPPTDAGTTWPTSPTRIVDTGARPVGITSHGWVLYRQASVLSAAKLPSGETSVDISAESGTLHVRGRVAFYFANIDYETNLADLMVWSGGTCARQVGNTLVAEDLVAASDDGEHVLFADNVTDTTFDVVVATRDLSVRQVLIPNVGRVTEQTCRASYGFAGDRILVAWCAAGSREATLEVFDKQDAAWLSTQIGTGLSTTWAADATGQRIVYLTSGSQARLWEAGDQGVIDQGVGWARLVPDGSVAFYTVGDQLRRTPLPNPLPIPVVTNKFRVTAGFSPDFGHVVYSNVVEYDGGERRDLFSTPTADFNPTPRVLVDPPAARLTRSTFTADGQHALYRTNVNAEGTGTLNVAPMAGGDALTFDGVHTAVAATAGTVLFTDNLSAPGTYPVTADLQRVDASSGGSATLVQSQVIGGGEFYLTPDPQAVVYARPPATASPDAEGIWLHPL